MPPQDEVYEVEVLEGEIVPQPLTQLERVDAEQLPLRAAQPTVHTAVAMATGFVAGAATMALLRRYGPTRLERPAPATALEPQRPPQVRTYVVHVRQIG